MIARDLLMPSTPDSQLHPRWNQLLDWLEQHGMDVNGSYLPEPRERLGAGHGLFSRRTCPPGTVLFTIPATALLNANTLKPHYHQSRPHLTAVQLISLHLWWNKPKGIDNVSYDPLFGPYINTLPTSFDFHPLLWLIRKTHLASSSAREAEFCESLPQSILFNLQKLYSRFIQDWEQVREYIARNRKAPDDREGDDQRLIDYAWAWLNVNTRCIYHRLRPLRSDPDNLTMCPILDFANHTPSGPHMLPLPSHGEIWNTGPRRKIGDAFTLLSPADTSVGEGEEMYLTYGAHSNRVLFTEYGFVNGASARDFATGEIDLQFHIEHLFKQRGEVGEWMEAVLRQEGYWGDWTLHCSPSPAHPDYRLITALRLYHTVQVTDGVVPTNEDRVLTPWRETIMGKRAILSVENERLWRGTLRGVCSTLNGEARRWLGEWKGTELKGEEEDWCIWMRESIEKLWKEEEVVTEAVVSSLDSDIEF